MTHPISFTDSALKELRRLQQTEATPSPFLRVGVKGGGCAGMSYVLEWTAEKAQTEENWQLEGLQILFRKEDLP